MIHRPPSDAEDLDRLANLKAIRFKSATVEQQIAMLEARITADPKKWKVGDGVGWRVHGKQINRGFRIVKLMPESKTAIIRSVADTGLTSTGGDHDAIADQLVHIAVLIRDRKYDLRETR